MYVNGGSEEEWMNRLADAMIPYLNASGNPNLYHAYKERDLCNIPSAVKAHDGRGEFFHHPRFSGARL